MRFTKTKTLLFLILISCGVLVAVVFTMAQDTKTGASSSPFTKVKRSPILTSSMLSSRRPKQQNPGTQNTAIAQPSSRLAARTVAAQTVITPSRVLNLTNWKLTLPIDTPHAGSPDEIKQPELASFTSPYFYAGKGGVVFNAPVGGTTTANSTYPRSELREMSAGSSASWSNAGGTHVMVVRQAITHLPAAKPEVVAAQIHDATDDVVMVRLERSNLFVESGGVNIGSLNPNYVLGTPYTVKIVAAAGQIQVFYNDALKVNFARTGSGYYFKAGCYTQSNVSKGESPAAYGEVVIYSLQVQHS